MSILHTMTMTLVAGLALLILGAEVLVRGVLPMTVITYIILTARRARHSKAFPQSLT